MPLIAYKVNVKDGSEELIRGFELVGIKVRILKDILFAGSETTVLNYIDAGSSGSVAASVSAPSIIIEEIELRKVPQDLIKPPLLTRPKVGKK